MFVKKITITPVFREYQNSNVVINNPSREQAETYLKEQLELLSKFHHSEPLSKAEKRVRRCYYRSLPKALRNLIPEDIILLPGTKFL